LNSASAANALPGELLDQLRELLLSLRRLAHAVECELGATLRFASHG
jgi:hypothetical protein